MHLAYNDNNHNVEDLRGTWSEEDNAWGETVGVPAWTRDVGPNIWSGDTLGWDDLQSLAIWEADDHVSHANVEAFVQAVRDKINTGKPILDAVGNGHDYSVEGGHPPSVTIAAFDNLDFNGNEYVTNDTGALRA